MSTMPPAADQSRFDIIIIGGGVNGCGIARDAAGRGYSVCLCEAGDLGGGTSSASTKLVHGGLRYLEHYEFRLVRESLMEREVLWSLAPHIVRPMRFVLPHHKGLRPAWLLRLGLFIYDHIGGRKLLPPTRTLDLRRDEAGGPLKADYKRAFEFSDCWVDDSRLVVLNARDAADRGADIRTRTRATGGSRQLGLWHVDVEDELTSARTTLTAPVLINAAGPWVDDVLRNVTGDNSASNVRLVRGSHIVVNRKFDHDRAYFFQNADERIMFAIPYEDDFTLIGTTDVEHDATADTVHITQEEISYLQDMAAEYFIDPVEQKDIVWTYSGVRPLYDDGASKAQEATRDYVIERSGDASSGALLSIFGGKITTYRKLSEAIVEDVEDILGTRGKAWSGGAPLPGGDFPVNELAARQAAYMERYAFVDPALIVRLVRLYGSRTADVLGDAQALKDMGEDFGHGLYEREVRYLTRNEWAKTADDILFRRTKLGIRMSQKQIRTLDAWLAKELTSA